MGGWRPGRVVLADLRGRAPHYRADWLDGFAAGRTLLAPTVYIFLASVFPALAFGAQLFDATEGRLAIPHVLVATAAAGVVQALLGGQPLLIVGVAEPIVVLYSFMYQVARNDAALGVELFRAWAGWACVWAAVLCAALALGGATRGIRYFTRASGELFGMLIAVLFMQQAVVGTIAEFKSYGGAVNGLWAVIVLLGLPTSAVLLTQARSWRLLTPLLRAKLSDYAAPLMVLAWTGLSAALPAHGLHGMPRKVAATQPWAPEAGRWGVVSDMARVPAAQRASALGPGVAIAVLFYFDHTVSAQLAQTGDLQLHRPPAYAYDLLLLAFMTLAAGLLGVPPVNGVLPQSPMHTRALSGLRAPDARAVEQRLSNLGQALLVGALVPAAPAYGLLPTCVLWAYFAFMAVESLPGSQFAARAVLLLTDPAQRDAALAAADAPPPYAHVPLRPLAAFTMLQAAGLAGVWALIKAGGVGGIAFPVPILLLLPLRALLLPRLFDRAHLSALDAAAYEQADDGGAVKAAEEATGERGDECVALDTQNGGGTK